MDTDELNEFRRRRRLRLLQVREQSKEIARRIRNSIKESQNPTNFERKSGTDRNYEKTLQEQQSRYEERLKILGTSHSNARIEEQENKEWKAMMETEKIKCLERGRKAGKELKEKEHAKDLAKSAPIERIKQARVQTVPNLYNSRHSKKPIVKKILSSRCEDKFVSSDDEFNSITDSEIKIIDESFLNSPPVEEKPVGNSRMFERDESVIVPFNVIHNKIERLLNENKQAPPDVTKFQNCGWRAKDVITSDELTSIRSTIEEVRINSPITMMLLSKGINKATTSLDPLSMPDLCSYDLIKSGENIRKIMSKNNIIEKMLLSEKLKNSSRKMCNDSTCEKLKKGRLAGPSISAKSLWEKIPKTRIKKSKSTTDKLKNTQPFIKILQNTSTQTITKNTHTKVETIEKSIQTILETVSNAIQIENKKKTTSTQTDKNELTITKETDFWTTNSIIEQSAIQTQVPVKTKSTSTEIIAPSIKPQTSKKAIDTKLMSTQTNEYILASTDKKKSPRAGLLTKQNARKTQYKTPKVKTVKYSPKPAEKPNDLQIIVKLDKNKQWINPDIESSSSTAYLSPGTYVPASEEPKKKPASNLDPRLKSYINRLLKMRPVDLNEFSVSSVSSVSISNSVIDIESNNPDKTIKSDINDAQHTKKTCNNLLVENKTIMQVKSVEAPKLIEEFNKVAQEPVQAKIRKVTAKLAMSAINLAEYVEDHVSKPEFAPILSDIPKTGFRSSGSSDDSSECEPCPKPSKKNLSTIIEYDTVLTEALNKTEELHDLSIRPFITYEDYIAQNNLSDHAPSASEGESSIATDKTLPDIVAELIKRNMITKPFTEKSASSTPMPESLFSSSGSKTSNSLMESLRKDNVVDSLNGELSVLNARIDAAEKMVKNSADSGGSMIDSLFRQSSFVSLLGDSECTLRELNIERKFTSTPVDLGTSSMPMNMSKTANVSNGLFSNSCDLSSVKIKTNNSDNDDLAIPNISLRFRNNNYNSSQSGNSSA